MAFDGSIKIDRIKGDSILLHPSNVRECEY